MKNKPIWICIVPCYVAALGLCLFFSIAGSKTITTLVENTPLSNRICIAIDAGHGGIDGGAESVTGIPESHINLEIAQRLDDLLHLLGYKTYMLRNADTSLHTDGNTIGAQKISDLKHRVNLVEEQEVDLLVSIHQNTFSDKRYSGAQVFYTQKQESIDLAQMLQSNFTQFLNPGSNRKSKPAKGIFLMEKIPCPGILVECGFLTNIQEEALLRTDTYQKKICSIIAATISGNYSKAENAHKVKSPTRSRVSDFAFVIIMPCCSLQVP